jgi:ketosteroid isomerase-like protein
MQRKLVFTLLVLSLISAVGCNRKPNLDEARTAIRTADAEWSRAAVANDVDGFMTFVSSKGSMLPPNQPAITGTSAIREWVSAMMSSPGFSISWRSATVEVAESGEMGYTTGSYDLRMQGPDGATISERGKYVTIWEKESDDRWRAVVDTFNSDVPPPAASAPGDTLDPMAK